MAPAVPCTKARKESMVRPVANPMRSNQNLRVFWKPVDPQDCVRKNFYRIIMRTILQVTEYKPGDTVEIISNGGIRWIWRVVEGMEALGTWLGNRGCSEASMWHRISKANSMFYAKKALFCDPKLPVKKRIDAFYSTCVPAALHGAGEWAFSQSMFQALRIWELGKLRRVLCLRRRPNGGWVDYMKRTGVIAARQLKKHGQQRVQTLVMRRVRIAAWQMVSCPSDAKGRRY